MAPTRLHTRWFDSARGARVEVGVRPDGTRFRVRVVERPRTGSPTSFEESEALDLAAAIERVHALGEEQRAKGLAPSGLDLALEGLASKDARARGRAARRLGVLGEAAAVEPLIRALARADAATGDVALSLGRLGDDRAAVALRELAGEERLARRRAGVEALRLLGDEVGLHEVRQRVLARIGRRAAPVADLLAELAPDEEREELLEPLHRAVAQAAEETPGLLDDLYELGTEVAREAVVRWLEASTASRWRQSRLTQPGAWRAVKSVFKRSEARRDARVLSWIAYRVERQPSYGWGVGSVTVEGGRRVSVFAGRTRRHLLRRTVRLAKAVGRETPADYPALTAALLLRYRPEDFQPPVASRCELFQSLTGAELDGLAKDPWPLATTPDRWDPPHGELWDATPGALVGLLLRSPCEPVHRFAVARLRGPALAAQDPLAEVPAEELVRLLEAAFPCSVELARDELERRFDPDAPDLVLIDALLASEADAVRDLAHGWLRASVAAWGSDAARLAALLLAPFADTRELAAELAADALAGADVGLRRALLDRLLDVLGGPEPEPGAHGPAVRVIRAHLAAELAERVTLDEAARVLPGAGSTLRELMAEVVLRHPPAPKLLASDVLVDLAEDELAVVREAARHLLTGDLPRLLGEPSTLLNLVESDWDDVRSFASDLLRSLDPERLGLDELIALCDSNRPDVQGLGRELVLHSLPRLALDELILRLAEHPDDAVRGFAAELLIERAPPGSVPLLRLHGFLRTVFYRVAHGRRTKRRLAAHLQARARVSEREARVVVSVVGGLVHARCQQDRTLALQLVAEVATRHPEVAVPLVAEGPPCS